MFKKRPGTAGIRGQLYETKLLSLILFRAQNNDNIEDFYLATNMDEIGAFDDICLKVTIKGRSKPVAMFIQAKHRENDDKVRILNNKKNLAKYFQSFIKIKGKYAVKSEDVFFNELFEETECVFVLYTNEKGDEFKGNSNEIVNDLISTGSWGSRHHYTDDDVDFLCKIALKEEIRELAARFTKIVYNKKNDMNDELILRYHVILAQQVINVSDIQPEGHRIGNFRLDFFNTKEDYLLLFRNQLYEEVLNEHVAEKQHENLEKDAMKDFILIFFANPSEITLDKLIIHKVLTYKNGQLDFVEKMPTELILQLKKVNISQAKIDEAIARAGKYILKSCKFQLPSAFGNKDLAVRNEKRVNHLAAKLLEIIDNKDLTHNIIMINETNIDNGILRLNGGINSAVGNILIYDKDTKLLKFTDDFTHLETHSESLLRKLYSRIQHLAEYRLDVRVKQFPKLAFDYKDETNKLLVEEFFSKLMLYTNQEDETGVEIILKQEIDDYEITEDKSFQIKTDAIFLNYHDEIQNWWKEPKDGKYLTKSCEFYQKAKNNIVNDLMLNVTSMMYTNEIRNIECTFKSTSTASLESLDRVGRYVIVTDVTRLTFIKVIQSLNIKDFVVLDLKYIVNLPKSDFRLLNIELKKTKKAIIIVCDPQNSTSNLQRSLQDMARTVKEKNIIIITNKIFSNSIMNIFQNSSLVTDEGNSLLDLNEESLRNIIKDAKVIFQGQEVGLNMILDDVSVAYVKRTMLNKVLSHETIILGESLEFPSRPFDLLHYDSTKLKYKIQDLYIDRRVSRNLAESGYECNMLQSLDDINDDVVLITAKPGIGKSTLLSYLSIKTKELNPSLWVMRVNLLEYSKQFNKWKKYDTVIDSLVVLKLMCHVILKNKLKYSNKITITLHDLNGEVFLKEDIDDEEIQFELDMFLHYFRKGNLIFLFDGFDEICPNYEDQVISFLNVVRSFRKHKIWVTSRPYNKIKHILQQNFGILMPYELEPFSETEQEIYFEKFWKHNVVLSELNGAQLENLKVFIDFMLKRGNSVFVENFSRINKPQNYILNKVYYHFMVYLKNEMKVLPMVFPLDWKYKDKLDVSVKISARSQDLFRLHVGEEGIKDTLEFVGTPLHLYLVAKYFLNGITDKRQKSHQWDLDVNTYAIYESFLESKLKKIRFKDKNKMDIDNPDILETYEIIRKEFIEMHKILAAYAIFETNGQKIFSKNELDNINYMIEKIKRGKEKTGLIYNISNNIPQFIHMTFTEYFAVEHVSDMLKKETCEEKRQSTCDFIINTMLFESPTNVLNIMDQKLTMDTEFATAIKNNSEYIFNLLISKTHDHTRKCEHLKSPLNELLTKNLNNFLSIFMSILITKTNENNLNEFIYVIAKTGFIKMATSMRYEDLFLSVLELIRNVDVIKWRDFLSNPSYYCDDIINHFQTQRVIRHHYLSYFTRSEEYKNEALIMNNEIA